MASVSQENIASEKANFKNSVLDQDRSPLLSGMNPSQINAVKHGDGPALILAGAGSGKTRVITHRIAHLIQECEVLPSKVLAVTFTNKAAREMQERVRDLLRGQSRDIWITTFHSMGARILRKHEDKIGFTAGSGDSFTIMNPSSQKTRVKRILEELNMDSKRFTPTHVLNQISLWKGDWKNPNDLDSRLEDSRLIQVYERYQQESMQSRTLDFDDLLFQLVKLFNSFPDMLDTYQDQFQYIMVDEFQDTNAIQYHLIRLLSKKHLNVCVVGDEDQAIYSWRGAKIRYILDFEKDFSSDLNPVIRFQLNTNYRCPKACLEAANELIQNNQQRTENKARLLASKEGEGLIPYELSDHYLDEPRKVLFEIKRLVQEGNSFGSITILYRTHAQSRVFEQELIREGIPYQIFGGARFFQRAEILDILSYLSILHNPFDKDSLLRIINVPARGIGAKSVEKLEKFSKGHSIPPLLALEAIDTVSRSVQEKFVSFYNLYLALCGEMEAGKSLRGLIESILDKTCYMKYLKDKDEEERCLNLEELLSMAAEYELEENPTLEGFLEKATLLSPIDDFEQDLGMVTLMTLHNAKGLEFDHVFMVGMEEELFPHKNSLDSPERLEEERRLCYVGITRTMKELFLSGARMRMVHGETRFQVPSRFLREIGDKFLVRV